MIQIVLDVIAGVCLVLGATLSLAAGTGLVRFPDALTRLHAGTKPQVFGLILVVIAVALATRSWPTLLALLPIVVLQLVTQPSAALMVGRAAYRTRNHRPELLITDEFAPDIDRASEQEEPGTKPG